MTRNGELKEVDAVDLVPGDILQLRVGDRVPADCRIIRLEAGVCGRCAVTLFSSLFIGNTSCSVLL